MLLHVHIKENSFSFHCNFYTFKNQVCLPRNSVMECTQSLSCFESQPAAKAPDVIFGYLGINGALHPIKLGPNKIGRDPALCSIVINKNSLSRQHALINIVSPTNFMVMDLGSRNKTKVGTTTLQPYIPHLLQNGDTLQFGDIFGMFTKYKASSDHIPDTQDIALPETQDMGILETPFVKKWGLIRSQAVIPESPDASDKDDSIILNSQPVMGPPSKPTLRRSNTKSVDSNEDSIFWNASVRSPSIKFNLDESCESAGNERKSLDIHDKETQLPIENSIHDEETQIPDERKDSIHSVETQIADITDSLATPDGLEDDINLIHEMATQLPNNNNESPTKDITNTEINDHSKSAENKENVTSSENIIPDTLNNKSAEMQESDEEILFEDFETQCDFGSLALSQPLLDELKKVPSAPEDKEILAEKIACEKENICHSGFQNVTQVDESPEEAPTQILEKSNQDKNNKTCEPSNDSEGKNKNTSKNNQDNSNDDDDETDCDEEIECEVINNNLCCKKAEKNYENCSNDCKKAEIVVENSDDDENQATQILEYNIPEDKNSSSTEAISVEKNKSDNTIFDKPSEVLSKDDKSTYSTSSRNYALKQTLSGIASISKDTIDDDIFDQPTQILPKNNEEKTDIKTEELDQDEIATQILPHEVNPVEPAIDDISEDVTQKLPPNPDQSPFKIPGMVLRKPTKLKFGSSSPKNSPSSPKNSPTSPKNSPRNYYDNTQDLLGDLMSQKDPEIIADSQENYLPGQEFPGLEGKHIESPTKQPNKNYPFTISTQEIREIIHQEQALLSPEKKNLKLLNTDTSDSEVTPAKKRLTLFEMELPNSQEIHSVIKPKTSTTATITESSDSESETQANSEELTPIIFRKKSRANKAKTNLFEALESDKIPSRVITRVRKPTEKAQQYTRGSKILQSRLVKNQEDNIDEEIIKENLAKLKQKRPKRKRKKSNDTENFGLSVIKIDTSPSKKKIKTPYIASEKVITPKKDNKKPSKKTRDRSKSRIESVEEQPSTSKDEIKIENSTPTKRNCSRSKKETSVKVKLELVTPTKYETRATRNSKTQIATKEPSQKATKVKQELPTRASTRKLKSDFNSQEMNSQGRETRSRSTHELMKSPESCRMKSGRLQSAKSPYIKVGSSPKAARRSTSTSNESTIFETESPKSRKRNSGGSGDEGITKKNKTSSVVGSPHILRTTSRMSNPNKKSVMFTAFKDEKSAAIMEKLGATIVNDPHYCSAVVTPSIRRTVKLLCAIGLGRPIVGDSWLKACRDTNMFVDPWLYLLKDEAAEKRYKFSLSRTLVGQRSFLKGMRISATPSVLPTPAELRAIVECNGGVWSESGCERWLCVSTKVDRLLWPSLLKRGAVLVSPEAILGGVFNQQLDIEANLLTYASGKNEY